MVPVVSRHSRQGLRALATAQLLVLSLVFAGCQSARQPVPRNPLARHQVRTQGRAVVEKACAAHGGLEHWKKLSDVVFQLDDRWSKGAGRVVRPWPTAEARGQFQALLKQGYGRFQIAVDKSTLTYGLGPSGPWALRGMRSSQDTGDLSTAQAVIPSYLFFLQMPFSFLEYDGVQHYMGVHPAPPGGPVYEVLVTYPWYTGDRSRDWYVARFDTSTMRLRSVTYTSSMWGPSAFEYTDEVGDYVQIDSLWIPTRHDVRMTWPFRPEMHQWTVSQIRFDQGLDEMAFRGPSRLGGS